MSFERQSPESSSLTESMKAGERNGRTGEEQRGQSQLMAHRTQDTPSVSLGLSFLIGKWETQSLAAPIIRAR